MKKRSLGSIIRAASAVLSLLMPIAEYADPAVPCSFLGTTMDLSAEEDDSLAEEQRQRELAELAIKFGRYKEPLVQLLLQEGVRLLLSLG